MRRHWLFLIVLLVATLTVAACGVAPTPVATPTGYAHPEVLVDTAWVAARLKDPQVRLVDVSSKREVYDKGHPPGAVYVNSSTDLTNPQDPVKGQVLTQAQLETLLGRLGLRPETTVVLYDDTNSLYATRAFWVLKYYGHDKVLILNGGSQRWTQEGRETSKDVPTLAPTQYTAKPADSVLRATWDYVLARLEKPGTALVDARTSKEYTGEDVRSARGGHIPGAVNVEWNKAMLPDSTFRPAEELARLYQRAGLTRDKEIISYCQTGVRGTHTWFVLKYLLGYDKVAVYDGSWEEWGNRTDLPVSAGSAQTTTTPAVKTPVVGTGC